MGKGNTMRTKLTLLAGILWLTTSAPAQITTQVTAPQGKGNLWSDNITTLDSIPSSKSISKITFDPHLDFEIFQKDDKVKEATHNIQEASFRILLDTAKPLDANDPKVQEWNEKKVKLWKDYSRTGNREFLSYSWSGSFEVNNKTYHFALFSEFKDVFYTPDKKPYFMGVIYTPDNRKGVFTYQYEASLWRDNIITLESLPPSDSMEKISLSNSLSSDKLHLNEESFKEIMNKAKPLNANDERVRLWHYASWCSGSFVVKGEFYRFKLYLGGMGVLLTPDNRKGVFLVDYPA